MPQTGAIIDDPDRHVVVAAGHLDGDVPARAGCSPCVVQHAAESTAERDWSGNRHEPVRTDVLDVGAGCVLRQADTTLGQFDDINPFGPVISSATNHALDQVGQPPCLVEDPIQTASKGAIFQEMSVLYQADLRTDIEFAVNFSLP